MRRGAWLARIELIHDGCATAERTERHAAPDVLANRREVRLDPKRFLQPTRGQPRSHDLVEDQERTVLRRKRAQSGEKFPFTADATGRSLHRLDDHGSYLVGM